MQLNTKGCENMEYTRVNWENGEKTSDGYVIIDGETYNTVEPEYSGNTPVNAANLNVMDKGIEDAKKAFDSINPIVNTASNSGTIKIGNVGIEWGTVAINPGGNGYASKAVLFVNTYKNAPAAVACAGIGYSTITNVGVFGVETASMAVFLTASGNAPRTCRYLVIGELASSVPEEIQEVQENNEAQS